MSIVRFVVAWSILSVAIAAADPRPTIEPPFDAAKPAALVESTDSARLEEVLAALEGSIAKHSHAGNIDYPVAHAARIAAKLCRQDAALAYYTILRRYFTGSITAGGATRDWNIHLALTRAYLARCPDSAAKVAKMAALDRSAKPLPIDQLFTNLSPAESRPHQSVDAEVGIVGAWRFDPRKTTWVTYVPVSATRRTARRLHLLGPKAPIGLYTVIGTEPGYMFEQLVDNGTPDCRVRNGIDIGELEKQIARLRCIPGSGLTVVPKLELAATDLAIVQDTGDELIQALERARPIPQEVQIAFQREGKAIQVRAVSDYGRTLDLEIDRLSMFDPVSSTWKPVAGAPTRITLRTLCASGCFPPYHQRQMNERDPKTWVPLLADAKPALLHLRGKLGTQPIATLVFTGPKCNDVMIGKARPGMMATCVPGEEGGSAKFVPLPP